MTHPFQPYIIEDSKSIIIGTLPPEGIDFYYSNSPNTRMWDLLKAIQERTDTLPKGSYKLPTSEKKEVLTNLNLSMADIIYEYERKKEKSTNDKDIIPLKYSNINELIKNTSIVNLLFVYKSAAKWFLHSLKESPPARLSAIKEKIDKDVFYTYVLDDRSINCILLPAPLNRGTKGCTIEKKKEIYEKWISKQS